MRYIIKAIVVISMIMGLTPNSQAKASLEVTALHKAIASEDAWLNTTRPITAPDLKGRIIVLDFWTFCCINCMHIIPDLQKLEDEFGHDLTVIGVHSAKFANEKESDNIREAIIRYDIQHPVVNDNRFSIWQQFGVRAWPTLVLIDPRGKVANVYSGEGHLEEMRQDIKGLKRKYKGQLINKPLPIELEKTKEPPSVLSYPGKIEPYNNGFFISDSSNHRIIAIDKNGSVQQQIGTGIRGYKNGPLNQAEFNTPQGMLYDKENTLLYIADTNNHVIRQVNLTTKHVTTVAGTGKKGYERRAENAKALKTAMASPWDVVFYPDHSHLAIAMAGTHQLWSYSINDKTVSVLAGNGREYIDDGRYPLNSLSQPSGLAVHGKKLYFVDSETSSLRVLEGGVVSTLIGTGLFNFGFEDGYGKGAQLQHPLGIEADETGVYIADSYNHAIRHYSPEERKLTTIAGHGKAGLVSSSIKKTQFNEPNDIVRIKETLYVVDTNNHIIQKLNKRQGTSKVLNITYPMSPAQELIEYLPNNNLLPEESINTGTAAFIKLQLHKDWKINDNAPSFMNLLHKTKEGYHLIKKWKTDTIKTQLITLPSLKEGESYRLQASFYYCRKDQESICLIQSIDQPLKARSNGRSVINYSLKTLRK